MLRDTPASALTRNALARRAGVDPTLIRYYFGDMDGLFNAVLEELATELRAVMKRSVVTEGSRLDALRSRIETLVEFLGANPYFRRLFYEHAVYNESERAQKMQGDFVDTAMREVRELVEQGRAEGTVRDDFDPRFLYVTYIGAAESFVADRANFERLFGGAGQYDAARRDFGVFLADLIARGISRG